MYELHYLHSNLNKHGLYEEEVEEAFSDPLAVVIGGSAPTTFLLGRTLSGCLLEIGYKPNADGVSFFIFHAMQARPGQQAVYNGGQNP